MRDRALEHLPLVLPLGKQLFVGWVRVPAIAQVNRRVVGGFDHGVASSTTFRPARKNLLFLPIAAVILLAVRKAGPSAISLDNR